MERREAARMWCGRPVRRFSIAMSFQYASESEHHQAELVALAFARGFILCGNRGPAGGTPAPQILANRFSQNVETVILHILFAKSSFRRSYGTHRRCRLQDKERPCIPRGIC